MLFDSTQQTPNHSNSAFQNLPKTDNQRKDVVNFFLDHTHLGKVMNQGEEFHS